MQCSPYPVQVLHDDRAVKAILLVECGDVLEGRVLSEHRCGRAAEEVGYCREEQQRHRDNVRNHEQDTSGNMTKHRPRPLTLRYWPLPLATGSNRGRESRATYALPR